MASHFMSLLALGLLGVAPDPDSSARLPVVVLIGDSIRLGYAPFVAEKLKGKAEVLGVAANGGDSSNVLKHLDEWAIKTKPAVIHINAGLHDIKLDPKAGTHQVELDAYKSNLAELRKRLETETAARLIWATTTPVLDERHNKVKPFHRRRSDVDAYNKASLEAMKSPAIAIDDLHAAATKLGLESALTTDGVHFTKAASQALAAQVALAIESALQEPEATREAVCRWTAAPPKLDGKLDDAAWKAAKVIDTFPSFWSNTKSGDGTKAYLVWDDQYLYFAGTMTDAEMRSHGAKRNDMLWLGDVFELFLKPSADSPRYYEFQANPKSVILELAIPKRGFDFNELAAKPPMGTEAVAVVDGTLDRPGDRDTGWSVEGRIPWALFEPTGGKPEPGASWSFAICRYDYGPDGTEPVLMSSAPLRRPSFHRYEDYGRLTFEGPKR